MSSLLNHIKEATFTLRTTFFAAHSIKNYCSVSEAYIIIILFESPMNMHQILRATDRSRSTISHILKSLTERKFISLSPEGDYALTPDGLAIYTKIIEAVYHASCRSRT